jgi:UDP-N-acetylglucosamine 2-epimerase
VKVLSIVGARPQFIKIAAIAATIRACEQLSGWEHRILHTGQHYDAGMSDCFFRELGIPAPNYYLGVGSGSHGKQTGEMLAGIESALMEWRPDAVIVYGDTNSTLAGALGAAKLHIRVIHLEAGLRSFNRLMPEEINRIATDHLSDVLLCPTAAAMANAQREGLGGRSRLTGDVMLDVLLDRAPGLKRHPLATQPFALVTLHRAENTDSPERLASFIRIVHGMPLVVIFPLHPRLRAKLPSASMAELERMRHVRLLDPCEYGEMLALERDASMILTDSGGVQKEAYFMGVPCLTLRDETEWTETLAGGWNRVMGMDAEAVCAVARSLLNKNGCQPSGKPDLAQFGGGDAAQASVRAIVESLGGEIE